MAASSNKPSFNSTLKFVLVFAPLSIYLAYIIGRSYYQGYLSGFGISLDYFPRSTYDYFVYAYIGVGASYWTAMGKYIWWIFPVAIVLLPYCYIDLKRIQKKDPKAKNGEIEGKKELDFYILYSVYWGASVLAGLVVLLIPAYILLVGSSFGADGRELSADIKGKFESCTVVSEVSRQGVSSRECTCIYKDNALDSHGRFVARSDSFIALYDGEKTIVESLAETRIAIFQDGKACPNVL